MAKIKLDWFKLDCQLDDKMELVESEFGVTGFAVVVKLYQKIYGGEGYYCEWNDDVALVFARKNGLSASAVSEIVKCALRRGIFDLKTFERYNVLTSHGIQSRYFECTGRRKLENLKSEYLLDKCAQNSENDDISSKNVCISRENDDISKQNRIEENRTDKRRLKEPNSSRSKPQKPVCHKYGEYGHVKLTDERYSKLITDFGEQKTAEYIKRCDEYCQQYGKGYKDYNLTIRNWIRKDGEKNAGVSGDNEVPIFRGRIVK